MNKRLTKGDPNHSLFAGVCLGLSEYFEVDVTIIRLIWIITVLYHGIGLIPYIILALIMPDKD